MEHGYILRLERIHSGVAEHGCFTPDGGIPDMTTDQVNEHNAALDGAVNAAMQQGLQVVLYLCGTRDDERVATWAGKHSWAVKTMRKSWHNFAGRDGRTDVWFVAHGRTWHGVNIGDNQIVRCQPVKSK